MRCHTYKGEFIPLCWGAVYHGKDGCYCYTKTYPDLEVRIVELLERVMYLEEQNEQLQEELEEAILNKASIN